MKRRVPGGVRSRGVPARLGRVALVLCTAALASTRGVAQDRARPAHSLAELREDVARMQSVVAGCSGSASACDASAVAADEIVAPDGGRPQFTLRWNWLREALDTAKSASGADRQEAMKTSAARLADIEQDSGGADEGARRAELVKARTVADAVLARPEFGAVAQPTWWDRTMARLWEWIGEMFAGVGRLSAHAPWLGKALEWLFFAAAAVGLLVFALRNIQRQRLAATLRGQPAPMHGWDRAATDWVSLADSAAQESDWREAVHCLYWAAIVRLEERRAWRHNPARTPREYVRLLKPGTVQRESLGGLTGLLERVWYGLRPAGLGEYEQARMWFERIGENGGGTATAVAGTASGSEIGSRKG